ncbi:MAG TPA: AMP-binding protein [Vicinamibacterales bacterium]|nr:AMP-binding protein [Vicinamibacterales bacterium]
MNFAAHIAGVAARFPSQTAIEVIRDGRVEATTYQALLADAGRTAAWLLAFGIGRGDRAAILADNDAPWIAAYLGILQIGAVAVPLDTAYKAAQVRTVVENAGARVLFTTPRYLETALAAATERGDALRVVLISGGAHGITGPDRIAAADPATAIADASDADAAVILYTSGTTADPKGVVLTHGNLEAERAAALSIVHVDDRDAVLGVLPLFHALAQMANLLLPLTVGARVVFLDSVSSTSLLAALDARGITVFACVPQFFYLIHQRVTAEVAKGGALRRAIFRALIEGNVRLRDLLGWNPGRLAFARVHRVLGPRMRVLVTGGSRFDPAIGRDLYGMGFTVQNAYGLTETSGGATMVRPGDRFTTSVGQPFPGVDIRIAPRAAAAGGDRTDDGEILIRGPIVMREYFNRPDATAEAIRDGWLHTGDLGRLDADNRLHITGRSKEIIVLASGKNLYPEEIEAHYRQAPTIKELCVLGLSQPGQPAAERLHALVVPDDVAMRERGVVNLRELVRFELEGLSVQLPAHKRILSYDIALEPLPRTTTGKIRRHEVERRVREIAAHKAAAKPERPLTDAERAWLAKGDHAATARAIAAKLGLAAVPPDANLELDLGLDSMERVELLTFVEQARGRHVSAETRATIFTVRQLVEAVEAAPPIASAADATVNGDTDANVDGATESALAWDAVLSATPAADLVDNLSKRKTGRALALYVLMQIVGLALRILPGFRIAGREHLPARGPFIVSPNHQTYLDGGIVSAALPFRGFANLFLVGAAEYFQSPFMAWLARTINIVPVDPDANLVNAMRAGAAGLRLGKVLILFPEGERSIDGDPKKFRKGAAILASHLDVPIVPVSLDGLFDLWPRGRSFNWRALFRRRPITVRFGPPIRVARGQYVEGTAALRGAVVAMYETNNTPKPGAQRPR